MQPAPPPDMMLTSITSNIPATCVAMSTTLLLALVLAVPAAVQSCSCPIDAFGVTKSEAITRDFCTTYRPDIYAGVVVSASCNCIPGSGEVSTSSALNCQQYQLNAGGNSIISIVLARGTCDLRQGYSEFIYNPGCSALGPAVAGNLTVAVSDAPVEQTNLTTTDGNRCREACPIEQTQEFYIPQPCSYTIRVTEAFKGDYSIDDVVTVIGPDITTSCGAFGRRLVLGTSYMAGIGGPCSPIGEWTQLSEYSTQELDLLRSFGSANPCGMSPGGTTMDPGVVGGEARSVASVMGLLGSMLVTAFLG